MLKRLKHLVMGGSALAALALGSSAVAGAATAPSGSASTATGAIASARTSAAPPTSARGGSAGAMNHVRDGWIHDLHLTDHEHYLRHHQRLASEA
jgi:hypothetical protein